MTHLKSYECGADANVFIERLFGDCVYTAWQMTAFFIGLLSVFFWIIAQVPQFISNILRQSADALSPWFLLQWLLGDSFNFLGCVLTGDQLVTQTVTAGYFIFADVVILTQYAYYQIWNKNKSYLGLDESVHKPSSGYPDCKIDCFEPEKLSQAVPGDDNSKGYYIANDGLSHSRGDCGSSLVGHQKAHANAAGLKTADEVDIGVVTAERPPFLSQGSKNNKDAWMYEQRHRLRRLAEVYGLEYGHALALHSNRLHKHLQSERQAKQSWRCKRGPAKGRYKALFGIACLFGIAFGRAHISQPMANDGSVQFGHILGRRVLLSLHDTLPHGHLMFSSRSSWIRALGTLVGWVSAMLYLGSRFSQLVKNKQRQSVEGLSFGMVVCVILANTTYGAAILMRSSSWQYLMDKAPWLCGSFGTVFLDLSIVMQAQYYRCYLKKGVVTEYTPLLA